MFDDGDDASIYFISISVVSRKLSVVPNNGCQLLESLSEAYVSMDNVRFHSHRLCDINFCVKLVQISYQISCDNLG